MNTEEVCPKFSILSHFLDKLWSNSVIPEFLNQFVCALEYQIDMASDSKVIVTCNTGMESPKVALALYLAGKMKISLFDGGFEDITKNVDKKLLVIPKMNEPVEPEDTSTTQIVAGNDTEVEDDDASSTASDMSDG